ncbi:hypothetical protein Tco_1190667, partial [Tanacetum coccineum]
MGGGEQSTITDGSLAVAGLKKPIISGLMAGWQFAAEASVEPVDHPVMMDTFTEELRT